MEFVNSVFVKPFADMAGAPDFLLQVLWEGLVAGVLYALIALGFVLIYKSSRIFNFAQGIMVVFAALTLVTLYEKGVPALLALPLTPLISLIAGVVILIMPRLLNYIVAIYLIIVGLLGLFPQLAS